MLKKLRLILILSVLWVLLSGHYAPLMLGFGALSVALVVWLSHRMDRVDHENYSIAFKADVLVYMWQLTRRIILSNVDVTLRILGIRPLSPQFVELDVPFSKPLTRVVYANAITLTPGTASITLSDDTLLVHTLSKEAVDDLTSGDMASIIPSSLEASPQSEKSGGPV